MTIRAFLAIDLPKELKAEIFKLKPETEPPGIRVKWVEEENFHITLKFFGKVEEPKLRKAWKKGEEVLKDAESFKLVIDEVGFFSGRGGMPRVVWLGLNDRFLNPLIEVFQSVDKVFKKLRLGEKTGSFHPHITLFRIKEVSNLKDFEAYLEEVRESAKSLKGRTFLVRELTFFKSILTPKGPKYESLHKVELGNG